MARHVVGAGLGGRIKRVAAAAAVGQVVVQSVTLLQTIVLARLLSPTEVGLFAAGTVLTAFMANFAEGGMRQALVHRQGELGDAGDTIFWGTIVTGSMLSIGSLVAAPVIGLIFDSPVAAMIAAASSGSLLLYALTNVPEAVLQREFSVSRRLVVGPSITISFAASSVVLAALGFGVWSLVVGTYVSHLAWVVAVWSLAGWRPGRYRPSWRRWRELARFGFPLVLDLLGARLQQMVESIVVGRFLSTSALGFYRYGTRISRVPVDAIMDVVANALFPAFSRISKDPARLRVAYLRALGAVTFFAAAASGLIAALGEQAVVVLLGDSWRGAGVAVVAMAGLGLGKAFTSVSEEAVKGCGRTRMINWFTLAAFVLGCGLLVLVVPFGLAGVGYAISITALVVGVLSLGMARSVVGVTAAELQRMVVPVVGAAATAAVLTNLIDRDLLRADTHGLVVGIGVLALESVVFLFIQTALVWMMVPQVIDELRRSVAARRAPAAAAPRPAPDGRASVPVSPTPRHAGRR